MVEGDDIAVDLRFRRTIAFVAGLVVSALVGFVVGLEFVSVLGLLLPHSQEDTAISRTIAFAGYVIWGVIMIAGAVISWRRFLSDH